MRSSKVILVITIIIGVVLVLIWSVPKEETLWEEAQSKQRIEDLEQLNERLVEAYTELDYKTFLLEGQTDSLQRLLHTSKVEREQIKRSKDEKIRIMDTYADYQLYEYFSGFNPKEATDK